MPQLSIPLVTLTRRVNRWFVAGWRCVTTPPLAPPPYCSSRQLGATTLASTPSPRSRSGVRRSAGALRKRRGSGLRRQRRNACVWRRSSVSCTSVSHFGIITLLLLLLLLLFFVLFLLPVAVLVELTTFCVQEGRGGASSRRGKPPARAGGKAAQRGSRA